jgi:CheY-like chemotaxis protein
LVQDFTNGRAVTQGGRILVVDDEPLVRETVGSLLAEEGYVVDKATDGNDALAKVRAHRPDAILLDLMMPSMNGRQFLDALRDLGHADVPVIVMTAVQGLTQGVFPINTDVIEKPFDLDDLLNKVALAVYRSGRSPTLPPPRDAAPAPAVDAADDGGVVLLIDSDREALQRLDALLSARGYSVVSMTRVTAQLPRLARALEPRAIILDLESSEADPDTGPVVAALRATPGLGDVPILVFARARGVARPVDEDLLRFVQSGASIGQS